MIAELIDPAILGFILVGVMLFAIFVGFPISFTLIFLGFVFGYLGFGKLVFYLMTLQFSMVMTEQTLAAVPLFVFMGIMMEQAGLMERLFSAFQMMLAKVKGSLYYAVLFVSDAAAAIVGGLGMAPGANIGDNSAIFEATHGTAPKHAGLNKINPGSVILSGVMMLEYFGWNEAAKLVTSGISKAIEEKKVTYDLARLMEPNVAPLSCSGFAEAIISNF